MSPTIKSEIRKLVTLRSTYIIFALALLLTVLFNFFFEGYKGNTGSPAATLTPLALREIVSNTASLGALFSTIVAILFMGHEYRYNTIMYTLTANTRRSQVLAAKALVISGFAALFGLVLVGFGIGCYYVGLSLRDASLPAQTFDIWTQFGKVAIYYVLYAIIGLVLTIILRGVIAPIATLLIFPTTVEPLLSLVLKKNASYLPFTSLDNILNAAVIQNASTSSAKAILVSSVYVVVTGVVAWLLFLRRDAN